MTRPRTGSPFEAIVYHGGRGRFHRFDKSRGIFFTNDLEYAREYGKVQRCRVKLSSPVVYSQKEAESTMEIDRVLLMNQGYDGRIIVYDDYDGALDVIAFDANQVELLDAIR